MDAPLQCLISVPTLINVPPARFCIKNCVPIPNKRTPCTKPKECQNRTPLPNKRTPFLNKYDHLFLPFVHAYHVNTPQIAHIFDKFDCEVGNMWFYRQFFCIKGGIDYNYLLQN